MLYFITFSTYGSHLPGDARGSFDHVRQGSRKFIPPNRGLEAYRRKLMTQEPFALSPEDRRVVREAMLGACSFRGWQLLALHVRSNHVHGVVDATAAASMVVNGWKAYSTRALRRAGLVTEHRNVWGHGASVHGITTREGLQGAIRYVLEGQGEAMEVYRGPEY